MLYIPKILEKKNIFYYENFISDVVMGLFGKEQNRIE
jgi:hypothetical protein